mmetsp:Transcript_97417/g.275505  ORF Transcript_97417/g.275505 Transcript_97417/m.275505 type:complete len:93 (-) Transcript_97417:100-378(-)
MDTAAPDGEAARSEGGSDNERMALEPPTREVVVRTAPGMAAERKGLAPTEGLDEELRTTADRLGERPRERRSAITSVECRSAGDKNDVDEGS